MSERRRKMTGFSMIELVVALSIMFILAAMALFKIQGALPGIYGDAALAIARAQMRTAREMAIAQRRNFQVTFPSTNQIQLHRLEQPAGQTDFPPVTLSSGGQFMLFPGLPDTPAGFGNNGAIEFEGQVGGPAMMVFQSDGSFVDFNTGQPINGTLFIGIPNRSSSARALTILGATGRARSYRWNGSQWSE
jgi:type II secretory pathway pseudopilin PulG